MQESSALQMASTVLGDGAMRIGERTHLTCHKRFELAFAGLDFAHLLAFVEKRELRVRHRMATYVNDRATSEAADILGRHRPGRVEEIGRRAPLVTKLLEYLRTRFRVT